MSIFKFIKKNVFLPLCFFLFHQVWSQTVITIDPNDPGRTYEGIGGVSAGASSELLIDYPEPQRSEILDFLFKPKFGASLQQLKVEIGADAVVVGSEPSHARTLDELQNPKEEYYRRGYEYWLMKEAHNRNKDVIFSALEWAIPGYLRSHWTEENADYIVKFILGAKKYWGIDMQYISPGKNESEISPEWLKDTFKPALDAAGLSGVKILAPDNIHRYWEFCELLAEDPELASIVDAVGYHYIFNHLPEMDNDKFAATDVAKSLDGLSLWASEDWSMHDGSWKNAHILAGILNKMYIRDRVTAMQIWCPVDSYYDNTGEWKSTGLMKADQPWSGYYEVSPAVWAAAHFTQFIAPGWKYLDQGCGYFSSPDGGNYTSLVDPGLKNVSIMVYTGSKNEQADIKLPKNLAKKEFHVWRSNEKEQFVKVASLKPVKGVIHYAFDSASIYTLSTSTGQVKGTPGRAIPGTAGFTLPYRTDFEEDYAGNRAPRYFADIEGGFELKKTGGNQYLEQQMEVLPVDWTFYDAFKPLGPLTQIGSTEWTDYDVSVDVQIPRGAYAQLFARVSAVANYTKGYSIKLYDHGTWELLYENRAILGSGKIDIDAEGWTNLRLKVKEDQIEVLINNKPVKSLRDGYARQGMVGLGCSWHNVRFDNLSILKY